LEFLSYNWSLLFFSDDRISDFLCHYLLLGLGHKIDVFLMDNFFLSFMNNRNMLLKDVFLVDNRLDVFGDDWPVMLMDHVLVEFIHNILMMLMNYLSV